MENNATELADVIRIETGKTLSDSLAEVNASILQAKFFAGEGMRLYGQSLVSGVHGKTVNTVRCPHGVVGLIIPANTPLANIAWKVFPALICGNAVVLKASEDAPGVAYTFAKLTSKAGLPDGVLNIIFGSGNFSGAALVESDDVAAISFTGSTRVGKWIAETCSRRLARVSLELGGKNALLVCDDADLDGAVHWALLSAFSNSGQRCSAGSRLLVFDNIFDEFLEKFIKEMHNIKIGIEPNCIVGPLISLRQKEAVLADIALAEMEGGTVLSKDIGYGEVPELGYYVPPTIILGLDRHSTIFNKEVFGPVVTIHPVGDMKEALDLANFGTYGLTSAIHTKNIDRAAWFARNVRAGIVNVNFGTYGSEPQFPFGGFGSSGNGSREPGVEALNVYSELKIISTLSSSQILG
jgi:aldehyde dehydrogenase (NAD+)